MIATTRQLTGLLIMFRILTAASLISLMTACGTGTQPFTFDGTDPDTGGTGTDTGTTDSTGTTTDEASENTGTLDTGTALPPRTNEPSSTEDVLRFEADNGTGGLVTSVTYIPKDDEFIIDNLGFDGANVYKRDNQVGTLKSYAVYEADTITFDSLT